MANRISLGLVGVILLLLVLCIYMVFFRSSDNKRSQDLTQVQSLYPTSKKVILLVVDSLLPASIDEGLRQKKLPNFQKLIDHGIYEKDWVSSFPTMSVSIDCTMLTGTYPNQHRVPGLIWYNTQSRELINYGTGPMEIMRHGINPVLQDALESLNGKDLNPAVSTIYEDLTDRGLRAGSINGLIYRGRKEHTLTFPVWMSGATELPREMKVKGPELLSFGQFSEPLGEKVDLLDDPFHRLGMNNEYAWDTAMELIREDKLPDFLYVYIPDLDRQLHKEGPEEISGLYTLDHQLGRFIDEFGSVARMKEEITLLLIGDSGVSKIHSEEAGGMIDLHDILGESYEILRTGEQVTEATELVLAVNETMAYIYPLKPTLRPNEIALRLLEDDRVDLTAWIEGEWVVVHQGSSRERKVFRYKPGGYVRDHYGQSWTMEGQREVLDLQQNTDEQDSSIEYRNYPDGLARLYAALHSHQGPLMIVTAKPGYELADIHSPRHTEGGAHGSMHRIDSMIPMIRVGAEIEPQHRRLVDLKAYVLELLEKLP